MPEYNDAIGLAEAIEMIKDESMLTDPRLADFIHRIENAGGNVLGNYDDVYLSGLVGLLQSVALSAAISGNLPITPTSAIMFSSIIVDDEFCYVIATILKMAVGLGVLEEWH